MLALDSSVLLRYVTQDDPTQAALATELIEEQLTAEVPGYIAIGALLETLWVLRRGYRYSPEQVAEVVGRLLAASQLRIGAETAVRLALSAGNSDLPDRIIHELGRAAGCAEIVTFDRRFARRPGVRLLGR